MFNKYWREYPYFLQLVLLILMVFTMFSAAVVIELTLTPLLTGTKVTDLVTITENSSSRIINASRLMQVLSSIPLFAGTAFLFAYASKPEPVKYLGFSKIKSTANVSVAILLILALLPFILQLAYWIKQVLPDTAGGRNEVLIKAYMTMRSPAEFVFTLAAFAIVPAIGEEMFFRGMLMRFIHKRTNNTLFAVFMSGGIFALFHIQLNNLLSIFIMGMMLGYIYHYTGSIWASIIAHFVHNSFQITLSYMEQVNVLPRGISEMESFPLYIVLLSVAAGTGLFMLLRKTATPLPEGWSSDFDDTEQPEMEEEEPNNNY